MKEQTIEKQLKEKLIEFVDYYNIKGIFNNEKEKNNFETYKTFNCFVVKTLINRIDDDEITIENILEVLNETIQHGLNSGVIGEMIYNSEIKETFDKYEEDINKIIENCIEESGSENLIDYLKDCNNLDNIYDVYSLEVYLCKMCYENQINDLLALLESEEE